MEKPRRLAACEPCREQKMACDHVKPVCRRCSRSGRSNMCVYREKPFQKRRRMDNIRTQANTATASESREVSSSAPVSEPVQVEHRYPNAGHLGLSSHATIFNRLPVYNDVQGSSPQQQTPATPASTRSSGRSSNHQVQTLDEVLHSVDIESCKRLVDFWLAKGITLVLGASIVEACTDSLQQLSAGKTFGTTCLATVSLKLSENSSQPLDISSTSSLEDFLRELIGPKTRWETIALALVAAGRATTDISFFPPLYKNRRELFAFQRSVTDISDKCLEIALSLDSLNEVQLICQYESFILHSNVDGDQSYNAWRKLGDVISSLLFLGFNEKIEDDLATPSFLAQLRRSTFAQIYSDDKNVAVFLGRPPRLTRKFCHFQLPSRRGQEAQGHDTPERPSINGADVTFSSEDQADHVTNLRWTACCASLKEEILEALQEQESQPNIRAQRFATISSRADKLWSSLPHHLQLQGSLRSDADWDPFERDSLLGIRLTYLQILFLIANSVLIRGNIGTDNDELKLLRVSQEMLSLIVQAIILRDQLVNAGSSLLWKVAHYGLPATGAICLAMLRPHIWKSYAQELPIPKILQDLGVFASEIQLGGLLQVGDPNYALLHRATSTIESLLKAVLSSEGAFAELRRSDNGNEDLAQQEEQMQTTIVPFDMLPYTDLWGYEYDFWQDLGEHPSLIAQGM